MEHTNNMNPLEEQFNKFEQKNYPEQMDKANQTVDAAPDQVAKKSYVDSSTRPVVPGFQNRGAGIAPTNSINSANFTSNAGGWGLGSNGDAQFNGNQIVSGHFTPVTKFLGVTLYVSDLTSPNGTLSGATGDICLKGDSGKLYVCAGGTTWYAPA